VSSCYDGYDVLRSVRTLTHSILACNSSCCPSTAFGHAIWTIVCRLTGLRHALAVRSSAGPPARGMGRTGAYRTHALQQSEWWWSMRQGSQVLAMHGVCCCA